jgi:hypothetical protein
MDNATWEALSATPLQEVRRRAGVIDALLYPSRKRSPGAVQYNWDDCGGQWTKWFFTPNGRALLLTFDHEHELNFLGDDSHLQRSMYDGVPDDLLELVCNQPTENRHDEFLNVPDPRSGGTIHAGGGVFWYDGSEWNVPYGLIDHALDLGFDLWIESAFSYCLGDYRFGDEFTPETVREFRTPSWMTDDEKRALFDLEY